jgi:hypothetical protein
MTTINHFDFIENQELIQKLIDNGYGDIVDCFLSHENKIYTKKGRLNKSSACRELGWKGKQLDDAFEEMKSLLKNDLHHLDKEAD